MIDHLQQMQEKRAMMSVEELEHVRRLLMGEDKNDLLRKEDVYNALRSLRTDPVPSVEFQKGLSAAMKAIANLKPIIPSFWQDVSTAPKWEDDKQVVVHGGHRYTNPQIVRSDGEYWRGSCPVSAKPLRWMDVSTVCTCMTELEDDAYGPGGPMSGNEKPLRCTIHPQQDGKVKRHD